MPAYDYNTAYANALNLELVQGLVTAPLETPTENLRWLDAQTFVESTVLPSGLQPHTRNKGYNYGTLDQVQTPMTLNFDRDIEFYVDVMDESETGMLLTMGNVSAELIRRRVVPETDAYRMMRLARFAAENGQSTADGAPTAENVLGIFERMAGTIRSNGAANVTMFASSAFMTALSQSDAFQRVYVVNNGTVEGSNVTTRIAQLDGFQLIEVEDPDRMYTAYDFTDGFQPVTGVSQPINLLAVYRPAVIAVVRHRSIKLWDPANNIQGDGWLYQYRLYHDIFQRSGNESAIVASVGNAIA